ncbi:MAG: ABC transporter substrate-binding protein [Clostridia bacterium]|nr:ABC transporter substrate-binding protein [Clostridia bacterium]
MKTRIIAVIAALALFALTLTGCGPAKEPESASSAAPAVRETVTLGLLAGPTGVGAAQLLHRSTIEESANDYAYTVFSAPDEVTAKIVSGELDIAAVPTNLAAVLYKKTEGKVKLAAINTLGVLYLLTADGVSVASVEDLKGKTVYSSGQAAVPEYVFDYILDAAGIKDDVEVVYEAEHDAVIADLASGKAQIAVLPEPKVTAALAQVEGVSVALDLTEEWDKAAAVKGDAAVLSMGCVVVRSEFAEQHKAALDAFLAEYKASIEFMSDPANLEGASEMCETFGIIPKAAVAKKAIPNCNMTYVDGAEMKTQISAFYKILLNYNPASVGGALPDEDFYYSK